MALNEIQRNMQDARRNRPEWDRQEYVGKDGLDTTLGRAALYLKGEPAWHDLGFVDYKEEITDPDELLDKAGLLFETLLVPVKYTDPFGVLREFDQKFVSVRSDTGDALGVVGKVYTEISNRDAYQFLMGVLGTDLIPDSAGALRGGRKVFMSTRLPETVVIDPNGIADGIIPFLSFINSHDGQTPFRAVVSPWRIECRNTERFAVKDAAYSWTVRHTTNAMSRIEEARNSLGLTLAYMDEWKAEEELLLSVKATMKDVDKVLGNLWPREDEDEESTRMRNKHEKRIQTVEDIFNEESEKVGRNLYAVERAVTGYLDNFADVRPRGDLKGDVERGRALAQMEGTNDEHKSKAHKMLMQRVSR